ncbi:6107_t:CDS:2 [Diversispora eburnea]|uniref:6107_t:CDS:1 n=1 Tax=Diversispora eburnea TaxID=1213867 RepID=A0A9N8V4C4_9GLOM|nr:6107_t:CDS:2 [Diversispora eburnea]
MLENTEYLRNSPFDIYNKSLINKLSLPSYWNTEDRAPHIRVLEDGVGLAYTGTQAYRPGRNWIDASSIRADHPISNEVGIYYFEIEVIDKGERGCIGIGLTKGWEPESIGYHGDDGLLYLYSGSGRKYGPLYDTGDIVGCGINYFDKTVFFTKNGINLGVACNGLFYDGEVYPIVGMISPREVIKANFGQMPFKYNITMHAKINNKH